MRRVQIYLDDEELGLLDEASTRTGASRSELIRRAVRERYGSVNAGSRLASLRASAGAWRSITVTGAQYVDAIRGDFNERLRVRGL